MIFPRSHRCRLGGLARTVAAGASILALFGAGGCAVARPEVRATETRVVESLGGTTKVDIALELRNTSDDELELVEYDYVITLPDGASYGGKWAAQRALPPGQPVETTVPAVLPAASVGSGATGWSVSGTLRYRDPQSIARILYEAGVLRTEVGFSGSGASMRPAPAAPPAATGQ